MAEAVRDDSSDADVGQRVLEHISSSGMSSRPTTYEFWYTYITGANKELVVETDAIIERDGSITEYDAHDIYNRLVSSRRYLEGNDQLQIGAGNLIEEVADQIDERRRYAEELKEEINAIASKLAANQERVEYQQLIGEISSYVESDEASASNLLRTIEKLSNTIDSMSKYVETVRSVLLMDSLTTLCGRKLFDQRFEGLLAQSYEHGSPLTILLIDVDHFKMFNDVHGHLVGDQVLRFVGVLIRENVRGTDLPARFGGEEFAIVLPETELDAGMIVAENIRKRIRTQTLVNQQTGADVGRISISIGVASLRFGDSPQTLLSRADEALYAAKDSGRDTTVSDEQLGGDDSEFAEVFQF